MAELPLAFTDSTRLLMGDERFERYLRSFEEDTPASIRLNPMKTAEGRLQLAVSHEPVPWCRQGFYLKQRPQFTMDPLLHAGCYYVQEAASMFLDEVIRQFTMNYEQALDLCAAPGGKSTLLRAALPEDCVLYSNEPVRNRANILAENVRKWGYANHVVTNCYPRDYRKSGMKFDLILCDVPCSGEGMFRKDESTIREWSPQQVEKCRQLQRDIVSDAWECLNEGGMLIYSTCTFNTRENEENIRWILDTYDAEVLPVDTKPEWHITGSLLEGFNEPVFRFIPGISRGEGLFLCVLRKGGRPSPITSPSGGGREGAVGHCLVSPVPITSPSEGGREGAVSLSYPQAISYLRGEALVLPADTPRGEITFSFMGLPLGLAKNIGNRANNLYPKPWRIKTTHTPTEYEPILKQI